jgi:hypothetical protein
VKRLHEAIRSYVHERTRRVGESEASQLVQRAADAWPRERRFRRHVLNATAALVLVFLLIVGAVAIQLRSHWFSTDTPLPVGAQLPDEVIDLVGTQLTPFRVRDHRLLSSQPGMIVAAGSQLKIASLPLCASTIMRVVDPATRQDRRPAVTLPGCYEALGARLLVLPDGTVLLRRYQFDGLRTLDLGAVRYDSSAGRIVQAYPELTGPLDLLPSRDGRWLYAIHYRLDNSGSYTRFVMEKLYRVDLQSGSIKAELPLNVIADEPSGGAMALSPDGRTLYLNQMTGLAIFDTQNFSRRSVIAFESSAASPRGSRPWWSRLLLSAEAKGLLGAPGIAADPRGRWVAALGSPEAPKIGVIGAGPGLMKGIWLVGVQGTPHVLRQVHPKESLRAVAASLDGSVLYALEGSGAESLLIIEAASGRDLGKFVICPDKLYASTSCRDFEGFAGVRAGDAIAATPRPAAQPSREAAVGLVDGEREWLNLLAGAGIKVETVRRSVYESFFDRYRDARWFRTDRGVVDVVFFAAEAETHAIRVCPSRADSRFLYRVTGHAGALDSNLPLYFTVHANLFIVTDSAELDRAIRQALNENPATCR